MKRRRIAEREDELEAQENANLNEKLHRYEARIAELQAHLHTERHRYEARIAELEERLELARTRVTECQNQLETLQSHARDQIAAKVDRIEKLVQQLEVAERRNSHNFLGGESFLETEATPHLLNRALERVNTTSGNFTKLLMSALTEAGVDCTDAAKTLAKSVFFERDRHTKFLYQALVCKVLFTGFESECFGVEENAPENLDPEQPRKENFKRYKELKEVENPEELVYEDADDGSDFRRFCVKKRLDLIAALSKPYTPGVDDAGGLMFGEAFGPEGVRRRESAGTPSQVKLASSFVKFALSVFLVHKLAFSLLLIARIFRVRDAVEFVADYMEPIVSSAYSETDDATPVSFNVGFMVVPGFFVNKIVLHSRVYTVVKNSIDTPRGDS